MSADMIILGRKIITMHNPVPFPDGCAVIIKDGKIQTLCGYNEAKSWTGPSTRIIEAGDRTVLPGFIDCHVHLTATGLDMLKLDFNHCRSVGEMTGAIRNYAGKINPGQWVMGTGYNEFTFSENRAPTRSELDQAAPLNPVWISRVDHHSGVVNSLALEKFNLPAGMAGIDLDPVSGEPSGILRGDANSFARKVLNNALDKSTRREAVKKACDCMLAKGITSAHALEGGSLFCDDDVEVLAAEAPDLPVHVRIYHQITDVSRVVSEGYKQIGGCLLIDGSFGSRTAALLEPYEDAPGEYGTLYFNDKELQDFVMEAHRQGLQTTVHAIGDAAIEQIISAYEKALQAIPRADHRHRIEHFSLPAQTQIERCVRAGIVLSVQPAWGKAGPLTEKVIPMRVGKERQKRVYPLASLNRAGARVCGGSDSPISQIGPLLGIQGALLHIREDERLSVVDAISLFTTKAAWAGFEEGIKGRIAPDYLADIVILEEDLMSIPPEEINKIAVEMTIVKGGVQYQKEGSKID